MDFFVRYFVEIDRPASAVDLAVDTVPAHCLNGLANRAEHRGLTLLLAANSAIDGGLQHGRIELKLGPIALHGSTSLRSLIWSVTGADAVPPHLRADIEVGMLGPGRSQLAVAGRYRIPLLVSEDRINRGTAQRITELVVKDFVDGLAAVVQQFAIGSGLPPTPLGQTAFQAVG
jgi:hypothetical protein